MKIKFTTYFLILVFCQHFVKCQIDLDGEWKTHWCSVCKSKNGSNVTIHGPQSLYDHEKLTKKIAMIIFFAFTFAIIFSFIVLFFYYKLIHRKNYFRDKFNRSIFSYLDPGTHKHRMFWYNLLAFTCFF